MLSVVGEDQNGRMLLVVQVAQVVEDKAYLHRIQMPTLPLVLAVHAQLAGAPSLQHGATGLNQRLHPPRENWRYLVYVIRVLWTGVWILCWRLPLLRSIFEE
jgi:hypothetical protein